ncbi:MAG: sulfite exporter TauE/SafE family protein [Rhizobiaceae bacterium]|nr:sulfite exporter TauE/SafE family protein [Rhizobiaceae bacterium]MCV0406977.1 sulfite exporter TauE/SafE family protein [Rhizobiaceae bacterium]
MADPGIIVLVAATFLLAGMVKGVIGLGLPTVTLGLLTAALDLPTAMALLIVPSFVTNAYQASVGGHGREIVARLWPFLLMATVTVFLGASALTRADPALLSGLLGFLLVAYAAVNLAGVRVVIPVAHERWAGPAFGIANGILTGMTGSFVVPGVMFLQAIGLSRDALIQAMGMLFTVSTVALALALQSNSLFTGEQGIASTLALAPALAGLAAGQAVRKRLSEARFRKVFFLGILVLGGYIAATALA